MFRNEVSDCCRSEQGLMLDEDEVLQKLTPEQSSQNGNFPQCSAQTL